MLVGVAVAQAVAGPALAAPSADIVIVWAPAPLGPASDAIADVARRAGAAFVDTSRAAAPPADPRTLIRRGTAAYAGLEFDAAQAAFDGAIAIVDQTGAALLDQTALGDLFLYRGLTRIQRFDEAAAWEDFVAAAAIDPTRVLDPAGFPPTALDRFTQAKTQVAGLERGRVKLVGPPGCDVRIDGAAVSVAEIDLLFGRHWMAAACPGHEPVRTRFVVDRAASELAIAGAPIAPPDDAAILIQGRTASARAIVVVTVQSETAVVRRIGIDGKQQDRATVSATGRDLADAVARLLAPPPLVRAEPWYRSRWVWAIAGVVVASAILIPIAASDTGGVPGVVVRPTGVPPW
jgi:hypothetical protein